MLGASAASASGCDPHTFCTGKLVVATVSPYKTWAYVYTCSGEAPVLISRAKAQISTSIAYGVDSITGIGPESKVELVVVGSYYDGQWYCKKKA